MKLNPMNDKSMEPKRHPRAEAKKSGGGKKFALTSKAKYGIDGSQDVPRAPRTEAKKSGKKASHFTPGSNASGGYGTKGVSGSGSGNFGTRGVGGA